MITIPDLQTAQLDLLYEVQGTDIKLIIGGGFGYKNSKQVRQRADLPRAGAVSDGGDRHRRGRAE